MAQSLIPSDINQQSGPLFHLSINPSASKTIILIHGLFSSHLEFALVTPHLPDYHLLLVDLPAHSRSSHTTPFTLYNSATHIASIIRSKAHDGRAHIVGLSAGGFVGLQLATHFPNLVSSLWISGATPFRGYQRWFAEHPRPLYLVLSTSTNGVPKWLYSRLCQWVGVLPHDELRQEIQANFSMKLLREGFGSIAETTVDNAIEPLAMTGARTLAVVGELQDDVPVAREMGRQLREHGSPGSRAAVVKGAVHAWDLQFPELFAKSIRAWIEGSELPEGMEELR